MPIQHLAGNKNGRFVVYHIFYHCLFQNYRYRDTNKKKIEKSPKRESNTRPAAYEADALPTELLRHTRWAVLLIDKEWNLKEVKTYGK